MSDASIRVENLLPLFSKKVREGDRKGLFRFKSTRMVPKYFQLQHFFFYRGSKKERERKREREGGEKQRFIAGINMLDIISFHSKLPTAQPGCNLLTPFYA